MCSSIAECWQGEWWGRFLCGVLAGGVVGACTGPLKNFQTRVIAQKGGRTAAEVASTAVHNRALRDNILSSGLKMPIIMTALNRGIQFYTFETVKAWLLRANQKHPKTFQLPESLPPSSVAGGAAGMAATLLLYPFSAVGDHMSLQVGVVVGKRVHVSLRLSVARGAAGLPVAILLLYPFSAVGDHMSLQSGKYSGPLQALVGVAQQHGASQLFSVDRGNMRVCAIPGGSSTAARRLTAVHTFSPSILRTISLTYSRFQPGKYPGLRQALVGVAQQHGASQLFRGVVPKLASMVPASAMNFLVFESLKDEIKVSWPPSMVPASAINTLVFDSLKQEIKRRRNGKDPSAVRTLVAGAIAGAASTIVTHPFELCRREINMSLLPKHATPTGGHLEYNSLRQAMRGIVMKDGVRGLYRGVLPSLIELVPATAIGFLVYEMGKRVMVAEGQERRDEVKG
ncbi:unnamed protein product [Closterium sp. Yama58-4]|nr:unnamed protein product [Closterium sp. Yama58-4]